MTQPWDAARAASKRRTRKYKVCGPVGDERNNRPIVACCGRPSPFCSCTPPETPSQQMARVGHITVPLAGCRFAYRPGIDRSYREEHTDACAMGKAPCDLRRKP